MFGRLMDRVTQEANPEDLIRMVFAQLPEARQTTAQELGSFFAGVREIGPPEAPAWAWRLFLTAGQAHGVSPELLAAVSWALVDYSPTGRERRVGILGLPDLWVPTSQEPLDLEAAVGDLARGDQGASQRVYAGAMYGTRAIATAAADQGSTYHGLREYVQAGGPEEEAADLLGRILLGTTILLVRQMGAETPEGD